MGTGKKIPRAISRCPHCKELLEAVEVTKAVVAEWNYDQEDPDEAKYEDNGQGSVVVSCHKCGKPIASWNAQQRDTDHLPIGLDDVLSEF